MKSEATMNLIKIIKYVIVRFIVFNKSHKLLLVEYANFIYAEKIK